MPGTQNGREHWDKHVEAHLIPTVLTIGQEPTVVAGLRNKSPFLADNGRLRPTNRRFPSCCSLALRSTLPGRSTTRASPQERLSPGTYASQIRLRLSPRRSRLLPPIACSNYCAISGSCQQQKSPSLINPVAEGITPSSAIQLGRRGDRLVSLFRRGSCCSYVRGERQAFEHTRHHCTRALWNRPEFQSAMPFVGAS